MAIDIKRTAYYYEKAYDKYQKIRPLYEDVLNYTDPFAGMDASPNAESRIESRRDLLVAITEPLATLNSFIMSSLLSRGSRFAALEYAIENDSKEEANTEQVLSSEVLIELEKNTQTVFDYLEASNYYTVISQSMRDAIALGTGCFRILEKGTTAQPFTFKYQPINGLYIEEDAFGKPEYVFNALGEVSAEKLLDMYPDIKLPAGTGEPDYERMIDVMEVVMPIYDETKGTKIYNYAIMNEDASVVYYEEEKTYNPLVVFRFDRTTESSYGIGVGIKLLSTYRDLTDFMKLRKEHAELLVNPPGGFIGDATLFNRISLKKGARNFLGSGMNGDQVDYKHLMPQGNLIEIQEDIQRLRAEINEVCMGAPLGEVNATKNRTAEEIYQRMQLFRDKFSGVYEALQEELLQVTFLYPMAILMNRGIITFEKFAEITKEKEPTLGDLTRVSNFKYVNRASNAGNQERADVINKFKATMMQFVSPDMQAYILKDSQYISKIGDLMDIEHELRYTAEELEQVQTTLDEQRQQQMEQGAIEGQGMQEVAGAQESMANAQQAQQEGGMVNE